MSFRDEFKERLEDVLPELLKEHLSVYVSTETDFMTSITTTNVQIYWDDKLIVRE